MPSAVTGGGTRCRQGGAPGRRDLSRSVDVGTAVVVGVQVSRRVGRARVVEEGAADRLALPGDELPAGVRVSLEDDQGGVVEGLGGCRGALVGQHPRRGPRPERRTVADDQRSAVAGVEDAADCGVVAGEELVAGLASRHPAVELALDPGGDGVDVAGDRVVVVAHLEVARLDLLQPLDEHRGQRSRRGGGCGGLVGADPARDVDRVQVLSRQRLGGGGGLGVAQVGQLEARVGRVELARDVGMGLAVAHEEQSHVGS